jgi:hypothetical protein
MHYYDLVTIPLVACLKMEKLKPYTVDTWGTLVLHYLKEDECGDISYIEAKQLPPVLCALYH